ncbi:NAD(P)H-dependent oxidoreductase [Virgibacillus soli]|uniref:NAD(P)H-dependent oxidoreductase n=1 Tax=Paracerasibacillus soli TaxID=480284 RepID=A0ABU5CUR7_9BACI|nr:NAD(P)H-dependent oxidoreductase [Virgibacillus soli]MDY0410118.1 NAD(P)H-dependent oxidoreductase [Virgibacillus soli]
MKTLVIISHPNILESSSQQFLIKAIPHHFDVTVHHLENEYPDWNINVAKEQKLLSEHDRIIFQFPFYWYSSPALLKHWQDMVYTEDFAFHARGKALRGKEFGLVLSVGINEAEYQAGGREMFSISELTRPFQATAEKLGMTYLKPFSIFQFGYMTDEQRFQLAIHYQQVLTREKDNSLEAKEKWIMEQLTNMDKASLSTDDKIVLENAVESLKNNRHTIDELKLILEQMW